MRLKPTVVLVQPPYFRLLGSHNNRIPLELCYLNTYLRAAGFSSTVFNADWTGATVHIAWRRLFDNFHYLQDAAEGKSPLYEETVERIVSLNPEVVILSCGDNLTPWVDLGNAYTTSFLSDRLRALGIYTVGVGPFYSQVAKKFIEFFDAILVGVASPSIVNIVRYKPRGEIIQGDFMNLNEEPLIEAFPEIGRDDVVMTAIGCPFSCSFCLAKDSNYQYVPLDKVVQDITHRRAALIDIGDSIFPLNLKRIRDLTSRVKDYGRKFTCEVSVKSINEESLQALLDLGVVAVKMGIESGDNTALDLMSKRQTVEDTLKAAELIKRHGIYLTAYILLGGPGISSESTKMTYELCKQVDADDFVINVWSFHDLEQRDFRYDAHFSQYLVNEWSLQEDIEEFFQLQSSTKKGLGLLI